MKKCTLITAVALIIALITFNLNAESIVLVNPSFEQGHNQGTDPNHTDGQTYYGEVWGWISEYSGTGNITGQDDGWGYPDNGRRPDGNMLAFAQGTSDFYQTVSDLDTTKQYWLQLWYNVRNTTPSTDIGVYERTSTQKNELMKITNVPPVDPGFADKLYYFTNLVFTPSAASADIVFANLTTNGSTIFDGIALLQRDAEEVLIKNPGFEASGITTNYNQYGQVFSPKLIAGWEPVSWYGIGWAGSAFNLAAAIPDGDYCLFMNKGTGAKQTINNLVPGGLYNLSYYYNVRNPTEIHIQTTINDMVVHDESNYSQRVEYYYTNFQFIATSDSTELMFMSPTIPADNAVLIDDVSLRKVKPMGLTASQGDYTNFIKISWDKIIGIENYSLFRSDNNNSNTATDISGQITTNVYNDSSVTLGQDYYYWVSACSTIGCTELSDSVLGYTKTIPPVTPTNISPIEFNVVTAPVTFVSTDFSDTGGFQFLFSQWQVSPDSAFSWPNWDSGEVIPTNTFTPPANKIYDGTNYWQVRYKNNKETWSDWSEPTSFIYVPGETQSTIFVDTFNVTGSGDVNNGYTQPGRQFGNATPLTYKTTGTTETGADSTYPGKLTIGPSGGCSPNYSFTDASEFKIEFDVVPHMLDGKAEWVSLSFGKNNQNSFSPVSAYGIGLVFFANGYLQTFDGENITAVGSSGMPTNKMFHVVINAATEDFENEPLYYSVFIDGNPMIVDSAKPGYSYTKAGGFSQNYITMFNNSAASTEPSLIDNLTVVKAPQTVTVHEWTDDASSLIDADKDYTHHVNLNDDDVTINGVTFDGTNGMSGTNWSVFSANGSVLSYFAQTNLLTGSSYDLAQNIVFASGAGICIKLTDLFPYSSNSFYLYSIGWEDGERINTFSSNYGGAITNVDEDTFGFGNGIIVQYDYLADKNGTFTIAISPTATAPFTISAFANEQTGLPEPGILFNFFYFVFALFFISSRPLK